MTASWIVVGGGIALLLVMVLVLVRQGSPASLSDEDSKTPQRERFVVDRPAGPDAEDMTSDAALGPTSDPSVTADMPRTASAQERDADGPTH
jgi:hypothetical protein